MSSELERLLQQARETLPAPDEDVTRRARARALAGFRAKRRLWRRSTLAVVAAILLATGLGAGIGLLLTPSVTASGGPAGLGFLVVPGWTVLVNGGDGTAARPTIAVAANVPLRPGDDADGLPLSTLEALPPNGVVIVATVSELLPGQPRDVRELYFPPSTLPLRLRDARPYIPYGTQLRPKQPLGQYELRALVSGYEIDLNLYFGTERPSRALLSVAQRQLDRLVVRPERRS
jgi:hypothetical protein